jgi:hypothetical protein
MSTRLRVSQIALVACLLLIGLLAVTCKESISSPTAPGNAMVTGTVVSGDAGSGAPSAGMGLAGVAVRVLPAGQAVQTDGSGNFTLADVPAGDRQIEFSRSDIDARGTLSVAAGANMAVIATIHGRSTVVLAPRGNSGNPSTTPHGNAVEEIEGLVSSVGAGTLTVLDQRLGSVVVNVTGTTIIRKGDTPSSLGDILVGMRVHVKAVAETNGTLTASEIIVQDENTKTRTPPTATATRTPTAISTITSTVTPMP